MTETVVTLAVQELTHKHSEEASYKWKTFTGQTRTTEKGVGLNFVAPTILEEKSIAKLDKLKT